MTDGQLGNIVSWRVPKEVPLDVLRSAVAAAGLDGDLVKDLAPQFALRRAFREMSEQRVIDKVKREGDLIYFQFTKKFLDSYGDEFKFAKEAILTINTETGDVDCDDETIRDEAVRLMHQQLAKRLTTDLTRLIQRVFDQERGDLVPIREQGGAYFVPDKHSNLVDAARTLLKGIGGSLRSFSVRLGCADTSASVAESMTEYLEGLLGEFEQSCESINAETRLDVVTRRVGKITEIKQKLECYRSIMRGYADTIDGKITDAEAMLLRKMANTGSTVTEEPDKEMSLV